MNSYSSQIENHDFIKELVNDLPTIKKVPRGAEEVKKYQAELSEFEKYSISVFMWAMGIQGCFATLEHARVFLNYFRTNKRYKEAGIGRSDYINYHYFNYAITVVKIMDIALILTNDTFRLGNPEKLCRIENIIENSWVRSAGIDKLLKKLGSVVEPWHKPRNLFVHRGRTLDISGQRQDSELLYLLGAYDILSAQGESIKGISSNEPKYWYKAVVSGLNKEFEQTEKPLIDTSTELMSGLLPIYRFWRKMLTQSSNG